jgi:antitoxin ParD1/3/4
MADDTMSVSRKDIEMSATSKRTFGKAVQAGGEARQGRDEAVERWLIEQVGPVYDAMKERPSRGIPVDTAFSMLRAHHRARVEAARSD